MRIGNGASSFWYDSWIKGGPLCNRVGFVDIQDISKKVRDARRNLDWDLSWLATIIPQAVKEVILSSYVHINNQLEDALIWEGNIQGIYTIKAGYDWLVHDRIVDSNDWAWSWIWTVKAP